MINPLKLALHWQILIAILLAIPAGIFLDQPGAVETYSFLGQLFIQGLKMLIVPLIASAIITGMSSIGNEKGFARLSVKTLLYYMSTSLVAIIIGLAVVNIMSPGLVNGEPARELIGLAELPEAKKEAVSGKGAGDILGIFLRMVPSNIVGAAAQGQMLGIITFALIFGFMVTRLKSDLRETMVKFWQGLNDIMMMMTDLIMKFAPIGVFGLIAKTTANTGIEAIQVVGWFFAAVIVALGAHTFVALPLVLLLWAKVDPRRHFQAMSPALLTAFSTSSSAATLPKTMDCVQNRAGVSKKVSSFTLPLGATVNMDGTALYECVAAIFIAQAYGLEMTFQVQFTVVIVALMTSIGVAGIPSASLVAIVLILTTIGLPLEGVGLILAVDRILDMCRTSVNVFSDSCAAVMIAKSEGESPLSQEIEELKPSEGS